MSELVRYNEDGDDDNFGPGRTTYGLLVCSGRDCGAYVQVSTPMAMAAIGSEAKLDASLGNVAMFEAERMRGWIIGCIDGTPKVAYCPDEAAGSGWSRR